MARPREFRNAAEKQKAYRERKKAAIAEQEALRNAPPVHGTLEYWEAIVAETDKIHYRLIAPGAPLEDDAYRQWQRDIAANLDRWNEASTAIYMMKTNYKGVFA